MEIIELEKWAPSLENPRKLEYQGQPMEALSEYWSELQSSPQQSGPAMGGMSL